MTIQLKAYLKKINKHRKGLITSKIVHLKIFVPYSIIFWDGRLLNFGAWLQDKYIDHYFLLY